MKAAKREFWKKKVDAAEAETQVFKLMRLVKPKAAKEPPPQLSPYQWLSDPLERTITLRDSLFARYDARNDIDPWENS